MKLGFKHLVCLGFPFLIGACGSETPSFVEIPEGIITLTVDKNAIDDDSFDMDELMSDDDELSADATGVNMENGYSAGFEDEADAEADEDALVETDSKARGNDKAQGQKSKSIATASNTTVAQSADASTVTNTPDSGSTSGSTSGSSGSTGSGSTGSTPDTAYDARAVAKACLPHFRGLSQKIKVVDPTAQANLKIAPGTVIAFKLTGSDSNLNIHLPAGNDLPGVCFFVSGNHADVKFSTASQMDGFAYIAAGNQSSGAIEFLGGSPVRSHIELKGNQAALNVLGLDASLCQGANLKGNDPRFQCNP